MRRAVAVIPARFASVRFPGKALAEVGGKPLIRHVWERARQLRTVERLAVATDDERIAQAVRAFGGEAVMTGSDLASGTDRVAQALRRWPVGGRGEASVDVVVNLQADEPEMPAAWVADCLTACLGPGGPELATVALPIPAGDPALGNPNVVKVVLDHAGHALYFSRWAIPFVRDGGTAPKPRALRHVGLYGYARTFLERYFDLPASDLERSECLEQLRFLQAGRRIKVLVREGRAVSGIDTAEDYSAFCERQRG